MQAIAAEFNLSETVFVRPVGTTWDLRFFTPRTEVALCGHATLATAHLLLSTGLARGRIAFTCPGGDLAAESDSARIWLDFPRIATQACPVDERLWEALGCMPQAVYQAGDDILVEAPDAEAVRRAQVDHRLVAELPVRGVILTAAADDAEYDVISRFFAPAAGIDEDPVTGSAHCAIGPYWAKRLRRNELRCHQASARGGSLLVRVGDSRVELGGQAVTVFSGALQAPPPSPEPSP
jgi:PhzF family phenazine biosynthesis protein